MNVPPTQGANPFTGLNKEQLKQRYLSLPSDEQKRAYGMLDENQKKMIWEIFQEHEAEKKRKAQAAQEEAQKAQAASQPKKEDAPQEQDDTVDLMNLSKDLRKTMMTTMSNDQLVAAYKKLKTNEQRMVIWGEFSQEQKQAITQAAEMEKQKKLLESKKNEKHGKPVI